MRWNPFSARSRRERGRVYRLQHSLWLSRAVRSGRVYPRIPTRPVSQGGFGSMMRSQTGRARADAWWSLALDRVDDASDRESP